MSFQFPLGLITMSSGEDIEEIEEIEEVEPCPPETPPPLIKYNKKMEIQMRNERDWDCMERIFLNEEFSDCHIALKLNSVPQAKYPCHRTIISSSSEYFANMLKECDKGKQLIVHNIKGKVMSSVLEYMYFGWCELEDYNFACSVLGVAYKLDIDKLPNFCEKRLMNQITLRNVCCVLETAITVKLEVLKSACLKLCGEAGFVVLSTKAFMNATPAAVRLILSLPKLQVPNDMMVFRALWDWASYRCCKHSILLNEGNIVAEMCQFFEFIGFEFMSKTETKSIPNAVFKRFRQLFPNIVLDLPKDDEYTELDIYKKSTFPNWRKKLFLSENFSDCEILVEASNISARFPCHRNIVAPSSAVFARLLGRVSQDKKKLTATEIRPMEMYAVLKYIYHGDIEFDSPKFACEVLHVAKRYQLLSLILLCEKFLAMSLTLNNVCHVFKVAYTCKSENLKKACLHCIANTPLVDIVNTKAFVELDRVLVETLFSMQSQRSRETESFIFKALWRWAAIQCCKSELPVTNNNTWKNISPLQEFINFNHLSDADLQHVPEDALKKLREKSPSGAVVPESKTGVKSEQKFLRPSEKRKMDFPVKLCDYVRRFFGKETRSPDLELKGNIILFNFSINTNAYLTLLAITRTESPVRSRLQSLHIYGRNGIPAYFDRSDDDNMEKLVTYRPQRIDMAFIPSRLALFESNEVYSVEVNRGEGDCDFIWPTTELENYINDDMIINMLTENCYGLVRINFLPIS